MARRSADDACSWKVLGDIATHPDQFDAEKGAEYYESALALGEELKMRPLATASSVSASSIGAWARAIKLSSALPPRRRCTAR